VCSESVDGHLASHEDLAGNDLGVAFGTRDVVPSHIAVNSATHDVYVSNASRGGSTKVTKINGTTLQTSAVALNGVPLSIYDVAVNPRTNKIYVSGGELLATIDGKTLSSQLSSQTMTIGDSEGLIAVNAATNKIYFRSKESAGSQDSVTVMDACSLATSVVPTGQYPASIQHPSLSVRE
jgi:DNA-binding beta-propeller fold protein YncE